MPLVVICGIPCSGKTKHAQLLEKHFLESGKKVHLINEESLHIAKSDGYKGTQLRQRPNPPPPPHRVIVIALQLLVA
jgi:tRNA uridine 5-carbamoylmethylation protein Kti12